MKATEKSGEEIYIPLIVEFLSGKLSEEKKAVLLEWLKQSDKNRQLFKEYEKVYKITSVVPQGGIFDRSKDRSWMNFVRRTGLKSRAKAGKRTVLMRYYQVAASIIVVFSLGIAFSQLFMKKNTTAVLGQIGQEVIVPNGGKSELILPDGTHVWLNAGSHFSYKSDYGIKNRNVYLEGEGYFSVKKNPEKPFVVETSGIKIKALGTKFNVKAYSNEPLITTTLDEGAVKVEGVGIDINLKPKQVATVPKAKTSIYKDKLSEQKRKTRKGNILNAEESALKTQVTSVSNTEKYTCWKDDLWIIDAENLRTIALVLERKFNVDIHIGSPELNNYKFTGTFNKETLEQILNVIKLTAPIDYTINKGVVTIQEETKRKKLYYDFVR